MLEEMYNKGIREAEHSLNLFAEPYGFSQTFNLEKNKSLFNTARYINIISLDLKILAKHQAFSENEWEKRYFARQISLLVYESLDDILIFLGKEFKSIANEFSMQPNFQKKLNALRQQLNVFKDKHSEKLKLHRNLATAHRDKDTSEQLKTIYSISWIDSINISSEYNNVLNDLGRFLEGIMRNGLSEGGVKITAY